MIGMNWKHLKRSVNVFLIAACVIATFAITPQADAATAALNKFELSMTETQQHISVAVTATEAIDLYAYDLTLEYDPLRLKFIGEKNEMPGFNVDPKVTGGEVRLAHTKVGSTSGLNGTVLLSTLVFEQIRIGKSEIKLLKANLVDSKLAMVQLSPNVQIEVAANQTAPAFTDISGHWAEASILEAADLGFVNGYPDGAFRPNQQITRVEFTAMLVRALLMAEAQQGDIDFADRSSIPGWAMPYVKAAVQSDLLRGYEDHTFRGSKPIVRQELALIAVRALEGKQAAATELNFADNKDIQAWAKSAVASAVEHGLMKGKGNNRFGPMDNTTRAEAVTVVLNLLRLQAK
jgi:hypothetical protein